MGAWSEENFGNDDAGDWIYELERSKGTDTLLLPIKTIILNDEYLESPDCSEALAAAEVVAAGLTGDSSSIPKEALDWLNKKPGLFGKKPQIETEHGSMARQCVQKIIDNSELKELWAETEDFAKWLSIQRNLIEKLSSVK
ncbi:DUF4259 domain-containing protein [Microbulbifer sp. GL-2]|uniref:DUF4259 domain-containing protein n=1 Tax=Microbulbifer sp. GL-2 TaxID=2591606 RepID=UPI0011627DBA|nr:DUF4259 domain-containing protein [Microbulbifer sp. GL-2]BBM02477.1 hypothetical protein GL2_25510 [Microbulbifer sp. GL-2]